MNLSFTKMQGCGNDFVVVDATQQSFNADPQFLASLCDRRFGVGCDQVLVVEAPTRAGVDFNYRIFNPDGSEVGQCGNGARALARFIHDKRLSAKTELVVATRTTQMRLNLQADGLVQVDMGVPRFAAADIPLCVAADADEYALDLGALGIVQFGVANLGNPHAVIRVPDVDTAEVKAIGKALQAQSMFPESVNVGFLQVVSPGFGRLRVYERGAGETLACGSGACAAFVVARKRGWFSEGAELALLGGFLQLKWLGENTSVLMTGPAKNVFTGEFPWPN